MAFLESVSFSSILAGHGVGMGSNTIEVLTVMLGSARHNRFSVRARTDNVKLPRMNALISSEERNCEPCTCVLRLE